MKFSKLSKKNHFREKGFTFLEFIIGITLLGITSTIIVPLFKSSLNKSRQKEATIIVNSILKSAKSNYAIYAFLPSRMGELSKFAKFQKCIATGVESQGREVCKNRSSVDVEKDDNEFFTPSGNYKISIENNNNTQEGPMFLVKANPNGDPYNKNGAAVIGCYNPTTSVTEVHEHTMKTGDKGNNKPYRNC